MRKNDVSLTTNKAHVIHFLLYDVCCVITATFYSKVCVNYMGWVYLMTAHVIVSLENSVKDTESVNFRQGIDVFQARHRQARHIRSGKV